MRSIIALVLLIFIDNYSLINGQSFNLTKNIVKDIEDSTTTFISTNNVINITTEKTTENTIDYENTSTNKYNQTTFSSTLVPEINLTTLNLYNTSTHKSIETYNFEKLSFNKACNAENYPYIATIWIDEVLCCMGILVKSRIILTPRNLQIENTQKNYFNISVQFLKIIGKSQKKIKVTKIELLDNYHVIYFDEPQDIITAKLSNEPLLVEKQCKSLLTAYLIQLNQTILDLSCPVPTLSDHLCLSNHNFILAKHLCVSPVNAPCSNINGAILVCDGIIVGMFNPLSCKENEPAIYSRVNNIADKLNLMEASEVLYLDITKSQEIDEEEDDGVILSSSSTFALNSFIIFYIFLFKIVLY